MTNHKALIAEARKQAGAGVQRDDGYDYVLAASEIVKIGRLLNALADALEAAGRGDYHEGWEEGYKAASVERAVVEAQALERAANDMERSWRMGLLGNEFAWLRARAVEIREGRQ